MAHKWSEQYQKSKVLIDEAAKKKKLSNEDKYVPGFEIRNLSCYDSVEKNLVKVQIKLMSEYMKKEVASLRGVAAKLFMIDFKSTPYDVFIDKNPSLEILKLSLYDLAQVMNNSEVNNELMLLSKKNVYITN